jgi:hypothetical protein
VGALAGMRARDLVLDCLMIPPPAEGGPLPSLRPKRSAYGVAGLRSGRGPQDSKHALMT